MMQEHNLRTNKECKKTPSVLSTTMDTLQSASRQINYLPKMYGDFIKTNASSVSQIESALRSLTYIIPGRFRDQEIASESLHSTIQLLSLYHDTLLNKALSKLPGMPAQTPHTRYTRFWTQRSPLYRRTALFLQMIQYTELLWEMASKRKGEKVRWRVVILLEALKAFCRFLLIWITKSRPLMSPALPQRQLLPEEPASEDPEVEDMNDLKKAKEDNPWTMPRTGQNLPALPQSTDISKYLLSKVLTCDDVRPAPQLLLKVNGSAQLAEYLHIIRPVVYAMAMSRNPTSWSPWLLGLSMELAARQLRKDDRLRTTSLQKEEWKNRSRQIFWYVMRGPFYEDFTRQFINGLTSTMRGKIGLDLIAGIVDDYEFLWSSYYFSTATV